MIKKQFIKFKETILRQWDQANSEEKDRIFLEVIVDIRDNINILGNIIKYEQTITTSGEQMDFKK